MYFVPVKVATLSEWPTWPLYPEYTVVMNTRREHKLISPIQIVSFLYYTIDGIWSMRGQGRVSSLGNKTIKKGTVEHVGHKTL